MEAPQVMAEAGEGSAGTVAFPLAQLPNLVVLPRDSAACGHPPQVRVAAAPSEAAMGDPQEGAPPPAEGPFVAAAASVALDSSLENNVQDGEKALQTGEQIGPGLMEAKAEEVKPDECAIAVEAEERPAEAEEGVPEAAEMEAGPGGEVMEVVEEERKQEAGHWYLNVDLRMNPLEAIQLELDTVNAQADRAFQQLEQKFGRMRRHYLERRNYIIQNIPGFWMTAFRNHPQLTSMIRGQDAEMLRYITNLEVKELRHPRTGCKFKFFFRRNPFFRNKLIVKEYEVRSSGRVVSLSTPIIWRRGYEPQSFIRRNQDLVCSFFTWFSDHSLPESDKIAEIIKEDLWPNPLQYYLLREGIRRPRRRPIREPVEIPRPFGFQSG
ncbi:testis-specific Y-encoded-like protein 1 [Perognathus longimembris pacificus]|uniref:testis-specific Y-encoded-like protein 1 n=1 Tax=Perognathus longimembris pacificus TaxID=214514 RepID=UPI002019430D|nr:testis-specific Y-encoded-like protein 1 [Perognathus longimembris pacificus]